MYIEITESQATLSAVITWIGDRLGTPGAVGAISFFSRI